METTFKIRDAPDTDLIRYPADLKAGYRITGDAGYRDPAGFSDLNFNAVSNMKQTNKPDVKKCLFLNFNQLIFLSSNSQYF
jgi:hypothetical protein